MANSQPQSLFQRRSLDEITAVPDNIISVYVVERHIWADDGTEALRTLAREQRHPNLQTVEEFLIQPVRGFLVDIFRQMSAPYNPAQKDKPVGQGYWVQAEFGSGKSHLLSFVGALALGDEQAWEIVRKKEQQARQGRRESLHIFYEEGLAKKNKEGKGVLVAVKTLVGEGGGAVGASERTRTLAEYILDVVADQYYRETGHSLPLYPSQILAKRFLETEDFNRYHKDLARYLKDSTYFDEEEQQDITAFLAALNNPDPSVQRDVGERLWDFYERYLRIRPQIPMESELVLENMVLRLLDEGYAGLLLVLDEISLFMKGRNDAQRVEDEKTLVVLSNRLAKVKNLPVWLVCAAQEKIETKMAGAKNILARERLDPVPLLTDPAAYSTIALQRVRTISDGGAIDPYYEDYKRSFSWPQASGKNEFARFFPFFPPSINVVRAISYNLTTVRSALYFMLETLKTQRKRQSNELITLWSLFDDVVKYEEDPSGTTRGIANIKIKWPDVWHAYETARGQLDLQVKGPLKLYRNRADKIIKTLFLYHIADRAPNGLSAEELMNNVMEWKDHDKGQRSDLQDNLDHYGVLADQITLEIAQVERVGANYRFRATSGFTQPSEHFQKARAGVEQDELQQRTAWEALLAFDGWEVSAQLMTLNLGQNIRSVFRAIAPGSQTDVTVKWHGREITGRVYMRDLLNVTRNNLPLPSINSAETGLDFAVFVSSTPAVMELDQLLAAKQDSRIVLWSPDRLNSSEHSLLLDFGAYRKLVSEFGGRESEEARAVLEWTQNRLRDQMGILYKIVPSAFGRGRMAAADHVQLDFTPTGELAAFLTPVVAQVLDSVYVSRELEFSAPAPFNDANAINVVNGIVKVGEIERGAKPNRDISAAQNYGFDLRIMRKPNDRKLDLADCRYTQEMLAWIEQKLIHPNEQMPMATLYKNFMGVGGPGGLHYGLSKRMTQLYLLALVRQGKLRVSLTGKGAPLEYIDYSNIASVEFKTATLDAMERVQLVAAPEGWEILAPYAAVILDDPTLVNVTDEAAIQAALQGLLGYRQQQLSPARELRAGLRTLFADVEFEAAAIDERMNAWEQFLAAKVDPVDAITLLRSALDKAFGFHVYADDRAAPHEVDDLTARRNEIKHLGQFYHHRERLRAVARYVRVELPERSELKSIREAFAAGRSLLTNLGALLENETRLVNELLDPMRDAIQSYSVRYLQQYDWVTTRAEEVRQRLSCVQDEPGYRALSALAQVSQLGADTTWRLDAFIQQSLDDPMRLRPSRITRAEVERLLSEWPQPPGSEITLTNGETWHTQIGAVETELEGMLHGLLRDKAGVLASSALHDRLSQHSAQPLIAGLLAAPDAEAVQAYLLATIGSAEAAEQGDYVALLQRALRKVSVRRVRLADFRPSTRTLETGDVDAVVEEFRSFLLASLATEDDTHALIELD